MNTANPVAATLRDRIIGLELPAGAPLREEALAAEFVTSRRTVREALIALEGRGLVERERHRGARVRSFRAADIADLYQARRAWETFGAAQAGIVPPEATARVANAFANLRTAACAYGSLDHARADMDFHMAVAGLALSPRLDRAFAALAEEMTFAIRLLQRDELSSTVEQHADEGEHRAIAEAVARRDAVAAVAAVEAHIATNRARLVALADQSTSPAL